MRDVDDVFDVVVLHDPLEPGTWALLRERVEPGALIVSRAAHPPDADLETVSVAGLELGVVLR